MGFIEKKRWPFLGLPLTFTKYTIEDEKITVNKGFLNTTEDSVYMYKVLDTKLEKSLFERMFGLGTVVCYTGDVTDKVLLMEHVKNAKAINDFIFEKSEEYSEHVKRIIESLEIPVSVARSKMDFERLMS